MRFAVGIGFVLILQWGQLAQARGISLETDVVASLNAVLESTVQFHKSMFGRDEVAIGESLDELLETLSSARSVLHSMPPHDRQHLDVIINAVRSQVERAQYSSGHERREHVKEAFYQLAHMTRIYKLDPKYQVFFCARDRSHWVQRSKTSAKNPVNPETLAQCGKIVR